MPSDKRSALHGQGAEPAARPAGRAEGAPAVVDARPGEPAEGRGRARLLPARGRRVLQLPVRGRGRPRRLAVRPALGRRHAEAVVRAGQGALRGDRCRQRSTARASRSRRPGRGPRRPRRRRPPQLRRPPPRSASRRTRIKQRSDVGSRKVDCSRFPASALGVEPAAPGLPLLSSPACCAQSSSTSTSRSPGPGPTSVPTATGSSGSATGSTSTRRATTQARAAAFAEVKRHPELDHDEEIWVLFTERIIVGHGRHAATRTARRSRWSGAGRSRCTSSSTTTRCRCSTRCASAGSRSGCSRTRRATSTSSSRTTGSRADAVLTSHVHGKTKPHETIFRAMLERLGGRAGRGGDGRRHDRGRRRGRARGGHAGGAARPRGAVPGRTTGRLDDLRELPAALGLLGRRLSRNRCYNRGYRRPPRLPIGSFVRLKPLLNILAVAFALAVGGLAVTALRASTAGRSTTRTSGSSCSPALIFLAAYALQGLGLAAALPSRRAARDGDARRCRRRGLRRRDRAAGPLRRAASGSRSCAAAAARAPASPRSRFSLFLLGLIDSAALVPLASVAAGVIDVLGRRARRADRRRGGRRRRGRRRARAAAARADPARRALPPRAAGCRRTRRARRDAHRRAGRPSPSRGTCARWRSSCCSARSASQTSFVLALAFLCASSASAVLPIAPAGAVTQAGAGAAILVAAGHAPRRGDRVRRRGAGSRDRRRRGVRRGDGGLARGRPRPAPARPVAPRRRRGGLRGWAGAQGEPLRAGVRPHVGARRLPLALGAASAGRSARRRSARRSTSSATASGASRTTTTTAWRSG